MLKFFRDMKIWQKLSIIVILLSITTSVIVFIYVGEKNIGIAATKKEVIGLEYISPVKALSQHLAQHRGAASAILNGDSSFKDRYQEIELLADSDIRAMETADTKYGVILGTTERLNGLKQKWQNLKTVNMQLQAQESFDRHTKLISEALDLILDLGDVAGLVLDPELSTSYLGQLVLKNTPQATESLGQLRARGTGILVKKQVTSENKVQIASLLSRVQSNQESINRSMSIIFRADPNLKERLEKQLNQINAQTNSFSDLVKERLLQPENVDYDSRAYFDTATTTIDLYFKIYDNFLQSLSENVVKRNNQLVYDKYIALSTMLLGIGLSLLLAIFITLSITRQIRSIRELFLNIGMGNFEARAEVRSEDELGNMSLSLNAMLDNTLSLIQSQDERDRIQESIQKLLEEIAGVAEGDLTKEAEVTAEITGALADSFNYMIEQLRLVISNVQSTTVQVSAAAIEVQTTAEHLSRGSESQTLQIVDTSSAVEEMAASIQQVAENAVLSAAVSEQARANAKQGTEVVQRTIYGMNSIRQQVQETSKRIKRLGESSQEIGEIVQLISDIADRTSILALNASIQAAMAGEAGRGFAVVATEVERLAERSADATKRIGSLIKSIQSETNEAVSAMELTTREVVSGSNLANEAGKTLNEIDMVSTRLAELIQSISLSAKQQARGSESIAKSMGSISEITQQTAAGTRQAAVSIRNLSVLADDLRGSVSTFKLPYKGNGNGLRTSL